MVVVSPFEPVPEAAVVDVAPGSVVAVSGTVVEDDVSIVVEVVVVVGSVVVVVVVIAAVVVVAASPETVRDPTWPCSHGFAVDAIRPRLQQLRGRI